MRFSVLIPTRNRLELLRYAVETVRRQSSADWEIVIADNASDDDVTGYVRELDDPRIVFTRTDALVSVTENWNRALELSSGDYVLMLGDDDGLLQDSLKTIEAVIERFDQPDAVYLNAYLFAYPGAVAGFPDGYLQPYGYALFLRGAEEPFVLQREEAVRFARGAAGFHAWYGFNMQFVATSRKLIDRMRSRGPFYQSTFPDYFAMNAIFLTAEKIAVCPAPVVVIGISPKSYGHYYDAGRASVGDSFLASFPADAAPELKKVLLPGDSINNGWLYAMDALHRAYGQELGAPIDYKRYRQVQMLAAARDLATGKFDRAQLRELVARLDARERIYFAAARATSRLSRARVLAPARTMAAKLWHRVAPRLREVPTQFVTWNPPRIVGRYRSVVEVFDGVHA